MGQLDLSFKYLPVKGIYRKEIGMMVKNSRYFGYLALLICLVGPLSLISFFSGFRFTIIQPAQGVTPSIMAIQLAKGTSEAGDPVPNASTILQGSKTPDIFTFSPSGSKGLLATKTAEFHDPHPTVSPSALTIETENTFPKLLVETQPKEDRTPTRLVIKAIGLDAPVEAVGWHVEARDGQSINVWDTPDNFTAGWLKNSAPVGLPGNTVLDGHHNINGEVFKGLVYLQLGDTITIYAGTLKREYSVENKLVLAEAGKPLSVRQANARYIDPTSDERLTLVTCWPSWSNGYRLIIVALPVLLSPVENPH